MGIDLVDQDLQAQLVRLGDHGIEIGQGAEHRVDRAVIGDVVAEVLHRRGEEGRDPDRIDTQRGDMVQPAGNAAQVAHAVAIAVLEAARVDLVDRRAAPPFGGLALLLWLHGTLYPATPVRLHTTNCGGGK